MKTRLFVYLLASLTLVSCGRSEQVVVGTPVPSEIIDLGVVITADTPEHFWGTRFLQDMGFSDLNSFEVIEWEFGPVKGSNAYYTLFNHGGPHVDAPNQVGVGPGLDAYPIESFTAPLKVFDVSHLDGGRSVTVEMVRDVAINAGDIVIMYTNYTAPESETDLPDNIALTYESAEYLATIPIRAFGTDAFSVAGITDQTQVDSDNKVIQALPVHNTLLSRGIPAYEQLVNVDKLLSKQNMYFVGVPLNIKDGDGMMVRPVVFIY